MNFYQILLAQKVNGVNRNLTWYDNLFARFYNSAFGQLIAKFLKIKGNTLVWNQLVQNGNFADTSGWIARSGSLSVRNNIGTLTPTDGSSRIERQDAQIVASHKYYVTFSVKPSYDLIFRFWALKPDLSQYQNETVDINANQWNEVSILMTANYDYSYLWFLTVNSADQLLPTQFQNIMIHDLTALGIDSLTTTQEVEAWLSANFPLPYYDYEAGKLLSFNGTGLKATGKNLWDVSGMADVRVSNGITFTKVKDGNGKLLYILANGTATGFAQTAVEFPKSFLSLFSGKTLYVSGKQGASAGRILIEIDGNQFYLYAGGTDTTKAVTFPSNSSFGFWQISYTQGSVADNDKWYPMLSVENTSNYAPYETSTLSLPISTYFPNGMKSAGNVYDELTPNKATVRIDRVNMGDMYWGYNSTNQFFYSDYLRNDKTNNSEVTSPIYTWVGSKTDAEMANVANMSIGVQNQWLKIKNTSYSDADTFKNAMSGIYMYFEKSTYTETTIDPPLDLSYEIEWGGTEQLLPENTSVPTTSPILADMHYPDGDRADQYFTYREIEKTNMRNNRALSIILGRSVNVENPEEPLNILLKGE